MQVLPLSSERSPVQLSSPLDDLEKRHLVVDIALGNLQRQELTASPKKRRFQRCILGDGMETGLQVMVNILAIVTMIVQFYETLEQDKENCKTPYKLLILMAFLTVLSNANMIAANIFDILRGKAKKKVSKHKESCNERAAILGDIRWELSQAVELSAPELRTLHIAQCIASMQKLPPQYMETHPETAELLLLIQDLVPPVEFAKLLPSKHLAGDIDPDRALHLERDYLIVDIGLSVLQNKEPTTPHPKNLNCRLVLWECGKIGFILLVNAVALTSFGIQISDTIKEDRQRCKHPPHLIFLLGLDATLTTINSLAAGVFSWMRHRVKKRLHKAQTTKQETAARLGTIRVTLAKGIHTSDARHRESFLKECAAQIARLPNEYRESHPELIRLIELLAHFMPGDETQKLLPSKVELPVLKEKGTDNSV